MENENIYAIGDIHGQISLLKKLINKINPSVNDTIIFLGDYIDRGENSKEVIEYIIYLKTIFNVITLKGNHEDMMLNALYPNDEQSYYQSLWLYNGGHRTATDYNLLQINEFGMREIKKKHLPKSHLDFFLNLRLYYITDKYYFVHAGMEPGEMDITKQDPKDLLEIRGSFLHSEYDFGRIVVHGHTISENPVIAPPYRIGIDTGAVHYGVLTAIKLPEQIAISVE